MSAGRLIRWAARDAERPLDTHCPTHAVEYDDKRRFSACRAEAELALRHAES